MAERRRIVPDVSVILPAYFHEILEMDGHEIHLTHKARRLKSAIVMHEAIAFAPQYLAYEFLAKAHDKTSGRQTQVRVEATLVDELVMDFLRLPIVYVTDRENEAMASVAWDLIKTAGLGPQDCWYVACAMHHNAEFWTSHHSGDQLAKSAAKVHPGMVFTLADGSFDRPQPVA